MSIINHNYKFIALLCPKTGTNSLENLLKNIPGTIQPPDNKHSTIISIYPYINYNFFALDNYLKFTIIRNPFDLAVSDFYYRIQLSKTLTCIPNSMTFSEYIRWDKGLALNATVTRNICFDINGKKELDFYIRYENLEADLHHILTKLNLPLDKMGKLGKYNVTENKVKDYKEMYKSQEDIDIVSNMYQDIINLAEYKF
jgi:hypothetical protein